MAEMPSGGAGGFSSAGAGGTSSGPSGSGGGTSPAIDRTQMREAQHDRRDMAAQQSSQGDSSKDASGPDDAPARGAGGTSAAAPEAGPENGLGEGGSAGKAAGAVAAVPAAGVAGQAMVLAMFINYLKGMMMALAAVASNLWGMLVGLGLAVGKAAVGAVMGIGGAISGAVGGAVSAAAAGIGSTVAAVAVTAVVVVSTVVGVTGGADLAQKDGSLDCKVETTRALAKVDGSAGSIDALTLANAKTVYGVLSAWGMPAENIAGIIGNWDAESGVDPTSVQGFFASPQVMADDKKTASTNTDNGIGLGQWTFGRNANLRAYAASHAKDWWTLEMQLGFMLSAAEASDAGIVKDMIVTSYGTPAAAAIHFHDSWERSADTSSMAARRGEKATKWMGLFSGWEKNQSLADSILAQSGTTVTGANSSRSEAVRADCRGADQAALTMKEGGLSFEEATALMALYRTEGKSFLEARYPGAAGPGDCGNGDKSDNCVGFSTYFVNKYTSFQQYARGDGIDTAGSMAGLMGKTLTTTPTVYSVSSGPASGPEGHTFVVLGIQGDQAVIGEAVCGSNHAYTRARLMPLSTLTGGSWKFVDVSDLMVTAPAPS